MAQELGSQNTIRKMTLKINKKKLIVYTKKKFSEIKSIKIPENSTVNEKGLFKKAVSVTKLKEAWYQLKSNSDVSVKKFEEESIKNINDSWFKNTSQMLIDGTFKYPIARKINILQSTLDTKTKLLNITSSRVRIIEKTLFNHLEIIFEGAYTWNIISDTEFKNAKTNLNSVDFRKEYKTTFDKEAKSYVYRKKYHTAKKVFKSTNFGFRNNKSAHQALHHIKTT